MDKEARISPLKIVNPFDFFAFQKERRAILNLNRKHTDFYDKIDARKRWSKLLHL